MNGDTDRWPCSYDDVMPSREFAEAERDYYEHHGRPSRPYYAKCTACSGSDAMWELGDTLLDANHDVRRHAGYHGGLLEEHAEIIVISGTGREIFRHHAIYSPEQAPEPCAGCGTPRPQPHALYHGHTDETPRVACDECGHIPEEARWA